MKLSKLYSNDERFNNVKFKDGVNIILGKITDDSALDENSHNLGKSTLIELIDFMLLKEINKNHFLKKPIFQGHIFFLELKLNAGSYITIKRGVSNNTKISFKYHKNEDQNYINEDVWDYEDLPITSKNKDINPKNILNNNLGFNILKDLNYRKTVNYFFRTQSDYNDVFKLEKFVRGKDSNWKPILFELVGFNSEHMVKKYNLELEKEKKEKFIKDYEVEFKVDSGEIDKIKGLIDIKREKRDDIEDWLDKFDFYKKESNLTREVVEDNEKKIAKLNTLRYSLEHEIASVIESLKDDTSYNLNQVLEIYKEVEINFPENLKKSYQELLEFNKEVFQERRQYLKESLKRKEIKKNEIEEKLQKYNKERIEILGDLKDTNVFNKYSKYREDLIRIEKEIERHNVELENIDIIRNVKLEVDKIIEEEKEVSNKLSNQVSEGTELYRKIRLDFNKYVRKILNEEATISIKINQAGNVEFDSTILDYDLTETEQSEGYSYKKILCVAFDLSVLINHMGDSFYRVVYHDGSLESLDPRKQKQYIDLINELTNKYNLQYIFTSLESDLPKDKKFKIKDNIILTLTDASDDSGRLFGFKY